MDIQPTSHLSPTGLAEEVDVSDNETGVLTKESDQ